MNLERLLELALQHMRDFDPRYGEAVELIPGVRRLTARNQGPFTFHGTNTYLIGTSDIAVLDPGPVSDQHLADILRHCDGATVRAILVSHTHMDHSPGARALQAHTGAEILGCGPHRTARDLLDGEVNALDASGDKDYRPDRLLGDEEIFSAGGSTLVALETPGHTANHLCFAIEGSEHLFSADHVMAWATSFVAPPDGSMSAYMASLARLQARKETCFLPGHGGLVEEAGRYMQDLKEHRLAREQSILGVLDTTPTTIPQIVDKVYVDLPAALKPAAGLSVYAHLEDLVERGLAEATPHLGLQARYTSSAM